MQGRKINRYLLACLSFLMCLSILFGSVYADVAENHRETPAPYESGDTELTNDENDRKESKESIVINEGKKTAPLEDVEKAKEKIVKNDKTEAAEKNDQIKNGKSKTSAPHKTDSPKSVHSDVFTKIEAVLSDGSGPVGDVSQWQVFRLVAHFALPDGKVKAGDISVLTLPKELKFNQVAGFEIKDSEGNKVADAIINGRDKTITLTYTDYAETHSGVKGSFFFYVQIDREMVQEEEDIPLIFDVSGETLVGPKIHFSGIPDPAPYAITKSGWQVSSVDRRLIQYQLKINTEDLDINNAVIADQITSTNITLLKDSLKVMKGRWEIIKGEWVLTDPVDVTENLEMAINDDATGFTINLGDISESEGYVVTYYARAGYDLVDGEKIQNKARLSGNNITSHTSYNNVTYYIAGGLAEGYVCSININKTDENANALAGASFDVVRVSSGEKVASVTTDEKGRAKVTGLLKDEYRIVETNAPAGFILEDKPVMVSPDDFGSDNTFSVIVENRHETIDIPVAKIWSGKKLDKITVRLFADSEEVDKTEITENDGWTHVFQDLPKYNSQGRAVSYMIREDLNESYDTDISGDANSGFTIKNTEKTSTVYNTPSKGNLPVDSPKFPKTGDTNPMVGYLVTILASCCVIFIVWILRR